MRFIEYYQINKLKTICIIFIIFRKNSVSQ